MDELESDMEMPEEDSVDAALLDLIEELVGEKASDDEVDRASEVILDMADQLVSLGTIEEIPDNSASEEEKKKWLEKDFLVLKAKVDSFAQEDEIVPDKEDEDL